MSTFGNLLRKRPFRTGFKAGLVGLAVLGAHVAGTAPSAAATDWKVQIVNSSVGGGSFLSSSPQGLFPSRCYTVSGSVATATYGRLKANETEKLTAYADSRCQGAPGATASYTFGENDDRGEMGRDCQILRLWINTQRHLWANCV